MKKYEEVINASAVAIIAIATLSEILGLAFDSKKVIDYSFCTMMGSCMLLVIMLFIDALRHILKGE